MRYSFIKLVYYNIIFALTLLQISCKRLIDLNEKVSPISEEVIVRDNVFVLDSTNNDQLLELNPRYLILKGSPTFKNGRFASSLNVKELKKGDIVLGYTSTTAPAGFAAKIINLTQDGDKIQIDYEQPKLLEIFRKIDKTLILPFSVVGVDEKFEVPFKAKRGDVQLTEMGTLSIQTEYESHLLFRLKSDDYSWIERRTEFNIKSTYKSSCSIAGEVAFIKNWNLSCIDFKPKPLPLPLPVPIYVTPVFRLDADLKLGAEIRMSGEWVQTTQSTVLGFVSKNDGPWETIKNEKETPIVFNPSLELSGKIELGVSAAFEIFLYQFFPNCDDLESTRLSAGIKIRGFVEAEGKCNFNLNEQKGLEVKGGIGIEGSAFLKAKLFGILDAEPTASTRYTIKNPPYYLSTSFCEKDSTSNDEESIIPNEVEESPTSISTGDPHLTTFDKLRYSFMAVGEFWALKSSSDNFQIQVRQSPVQNSTQVSVNTALAIQTKNDKISVTANPSRLFINNSEVSLAANNYTLRSGGAVQIYGNRLAILTDTGDRIEVKLLGPDLDYLITPTKNRKGKLAGLFGNYDGNSSNELALADGRLVSSQYNALYPAFSDSWRIKQSESLFIYDAGKNTESYTDRNFPRSEIVLTPAQRTAAEQICRQAGVTDPDALQGCIIDVAATGDRNFAERAKQNEIISGAKSVLSVSDFSRYRNEFVLGSGATLNGKNILLGSKGTIKWNDAYINHNGYETEIDFTINAPGSCIPLFDLEVVDNQYTGDPNQNYLRMSANNGRTQVELVNSGISPKLHPTNLFDGKRHRIRILTAKGVNGAQTDLRVLLYVDEYEPLIIDRTYPSSSLSGYLYPMLKNETLNCNNGEITIYGWSFKSL